MQVGPELTVITRYEIRKAAWWFIKIAIADVWYPFRFKDAEEALRAKCYFVMTIEGVKITVVNLSMVVALNFCQGT